MKEKIIEMLRRNTKTLEWEQMDGFTATGISETLVVSRNVVSRFHM